MGELHVIYIEICSGIYSAVSRFWESYEHSSADEAKTTGRTSPNKFQNGPKKIRK